MNWENYVLAAGERDGDVEELWQAASAHSGGSTMFLLAVGFDPRCLVALQQFLALDHATPPVIGRIMLPTPGGATDAGIRGLAEDNSLAFDALSAGYDVRVADYPAVQARANAGPRIARKVTDAQFLDGCRHLIVDISSLPSTLYFPIVAAALETAKRGAGLEDIQAVACENPEIDAAILELGVHGATIVGGFRGEFDLESGARGTTVWVPVIGEHASPALRAIHSFLDPADTCPVLPFPARHPRRADELLLEHHLEIIDSFQVTEGNLIFADERNPFDLYRILARLQSDYRRALEPLAPVSLALSTHSSKLLSLGALLAAYEFGLPVVAAPASGYDVSTHDFSTLSAANRVACTWLAGEPFLW